MQRVNRKWRPPLALVIGGGLVGVLVTPLIGIVYFRLWGYVLSWGEAALLVGCIAAVATLILGLLLWRLVLLPVYALTTHAKAVKAGQVDAPRPQYFGTPEFRELGQSVFDMSASLQSRAASVRAFTDHVTHELKSPLTSIQGAAELLQSPELEDADRIMLCQTVARASQRMNVLLNDLRRHTIASQSAGVGACSLTDAMPKTVGLEITCVGDIEIPLAVADLNAIFVQLIQNAVVHGADKMDIMWDGFTLVIADNGEGVEPGNQDRIFDPFFTSRRDTGGTGMGLAVVRSLLTAQGGQINLIDTPKGATFEIKLDSA
jgi:two-component system OmpR family sensor kinase